MSGSDLFTGTLELLILRCLAGGSVHGYAVGRFLRESSGGVLDVEEGALYPALHRMERKGLLASSWGKTETGRRAKFYSVTPDGQARLEAERARWAEYSRAVDGVLAEG